jgi:hypothetical protein
MPLADSAATWTAAGTWATCLVLLATLLYVVKQLREAKELRREQFRPWVTVSFHFRSNLAFIKIKNLGNTAARNVALRFDPDLVTTRSEGIGEVTMLSEETPVLVPGDERLLLLDSVPARLDSELPRRHTARVSYSDHRGQELPAEEFVLDFGLLDGTRILDKGIHDLVEETRKIRLAMESGGS